MVADELRIGTNWASVTPPAAPVTPPLLGIALSGANVVLSWPTASPGFTLQFTPALISGSNSWTPAAGPTNILGTNYVVTNAVSAGGGFYRLSNH
jgi:hypothetical protein